MTTAENNSAVTALVLDGENRSTLAVVRSLGERGYTVFVSSPLRRSLAAVSRYTVKSFLSPNPALAPQQYLAWLRELLATLQPSVLLPMTSLTLDLVLQIENQVRAQTILPFVNRETFLQVHDKHALIQLGTKAGLQVPHTLFLPPREKVEGPLREKILQFPFPACLKPAISDVAVGDSYLKPHPTYPASADDVLSTIQREEYLRVPFLLQQRIIGHGEGIFLLAANGDVVASFAHKRLLEKPPSGGVSVLCESIELPCGEIEAAKKLCKELCWDGVMMVELKRTSAGEAYLMEINPRFWGSLQLAIDCGVDFPALLLDLFRNGIPSRGVDLDTFKKSIPPYKVGERLRWTLGTFDHFLISLRDAPLETLRNVILKNSLQLFCRNTRQEIYRTQDKWPSIAEMIHYLRSLLSHGKR